MPSGMARRPHEKPPQHRSLDAADLGTDAAAVGQHHVEVVFSHGVLVHMLEMSCSRLETLRCDDNRVVVTAAVAERRYEGVVHPHEHPVVVNDPAGEVYTAKD